MKDAFGSAEIFVVLLIITVLYCTCFARSKYGRSNPFDDGQGINIKKEILDEKVQQVEYAKSLREKIENNLKQGY